MTADLPTDMAGPEDDLAEAPEERDDKTLAMFGEPAPPEAPQDERPAAPSEASAGSEGGAYQVLARKYRPRTFEELIGQEAMVRTLRNAFSSGRIAHAFM